MDNAMEELKQLKTVLLALVVSSATQVDMRTLLRDYRLMQGEALPALRHGYRDPVAFLRERCGDCFLFHGNPANPVLTPIVTESMKHIDAHVQRQKVPSSTKSRGKRRSVLASISTNHPQNVLAGTSNETTGLRNEAVNDAPRRGTSPRRELGEIKTEVEQPNTSMESMPEVTEKRTCTIDVHNFLKKRLPMYSSAQCLGSDQSDRDDAASGSTAESGMLTTSSGSSSKRELLEVLKQEVHQLVTERPAGVWCTQLVRLYRERYRRELNFSRFGYTSVVTFAAALPDEVRVTSVGDDWLLQDARAPAPAMPPPRHTMLAARVPSRDPVDPEDALPGIDFEPDVFPADCVHYMESIPELALADAEPGALLEVILGEVYSPSHFWLLRLGADHNIAMEDMMDEMTQYYGSGEGRERVLAAGAVREGHYCSSLFERDWHRSLIVRVLDSDTVKVRHVDYGTVDRVAARELKPLLRRWIALPAQAVRARLAGVRPGAGGRRWPHAASTYFLRLVQDRRFVASVVARHREENILEVLLIDTSTETDVCVGSELVRAGYADPRPDSALCASESYLLPRFEALEAGATPNYAEIHAYLRDGIALDFVDDYRRHVPSCLAPASPPATPPTSPPASLPPSPPPSPPVLPPPVQLVNRVPLFAAPPPAPAVPPPQPHAYPQLSPVGGFAPSFVTTSLPYFPAGALFAPPLPPPPPPPPPPPLPPPPPGPQRFRTAQGEVTLSVSECEVFCLLSQVDAHAAHWYMVEAIGRALGAGAGSAAAAAAPPHPLTSALNPLAREFQHAAQAPAPARRHLEQLSRSAASVRPPPGFGPPAH